MDSYAQGGVEQLALPDALKVKAVQEKYGNVREVAECFGGIDQLKQAIDQLQILLYTA